MSALTHQQRSALRAVAALFPARTVALIGAAALRVHWPDEFLRATDDLDLTIAVELDACTSLLGRLKGWSRGRREHEWRSEHGVKIDVVPAGPALIEAGELVWPGSGARMNLAGLRHAAAHGTPLAEEPRVLVASRSTLALLKVVSYSDRPAERGRDLEDLSFLLQRYVGPDDPRRWSEEAESTGFDTAPAFLLGRDLGRLVDTKERSVVERFVTSTAADDGVQARMLRRSGVRRDDEADRLVEMLRALADGLGSVR